jgi:DNA-binding response OmpR family regulator
MEQRLELEGFRVLAAADGGAALALARKHKPDLILSDIMMPVLDGYGLLAQLRENPDTASIPVIFLTAKTDRQDQRLGMGMGADDYITKPVSKEELLAAVRTRLARKQVQADLLNQRLCQNHQEITRVLPHELLAPLTGILSVAELIETTNRTRPLEEIQELGKLLRLSAERMHRTLNQILLYTELLKVNAFPEQPTALRESFIFSLYVRQAAEAAAASWNRPTDLELDIQPVTCDIPVPHLQALLAELIDNAFKFSKAGTKVVVRLGLGHGRPLLTVVDQGRGMTAQQVRELAGFHQIDRQYYEQQGLGLGLQIVHLVAHVYQAHLELVPRPEGGLTASVAFAPNPAQG